jgi:hypothetical protein
MSSVRRVFVDVDQAEASHNLFEPTNILVVVTETEPDELPQTVNGRLFWIVHIDEEIRDQRDDVGDIDDVYHALLGGSRASGISQLKDPDNQSENLMDYAPNEWDAGLICRALKQGQRLSHPIVVQQAEYGPQGLVVISESSHA